MKNDIQEKPGVSAIASPSNGVNRATKLFKATEVCLSDLHGEKLTYEQLGEITGQSASTMFDWATGAGLRQVESMLRLLERLPRSRRIGLIERFCRQFPTIYHRFLSWQERQTANCEALLRIGKAITLVQGDEGGRDFLINALGNSASRIDPPRPTVSGIDARAAERFVPVDGVKYMGATMSLARLREQCRLAWPAIRKTDAQLILLNGIWIALPELHEEILTLAKRRHVVVADSVTFSNAQFPKTFESPAHLLSVKQDPEHRISMSFEEIV